MVDVGLGLHVEDAGDSSLFHGLCVFLGLRIWTDKDASVSNLVKSERANEVCIVHFNLTINNEHVVNVTPDVGTSNAKLTLVELRVLDIQMSARFSFPYICIRFSVMDQILVINIYRCNTLFICNWQLPWSYFFSRKPLNFLVRLHHIDRSFALFPRT